MLPSSAIKCIQVKCSVQFWQKPNVKDFFQFRNSSNSSKDKFESEINGNANNKNTTIPDQLYLQALENYENGDIDKALYARLFAENDGKEELVKAKYITLVVQKRVQSN